MLQYLVLGKLIIWTAQMTEVLDPLRNIRFFRSMLECDFCTGVWVYTFLGVCFPHTPKLLPKSRFPLVGYFFEGVVASFLMHLISIGWRNKFNA